MRYQIVPCTLSHLRELSRTMRDGDRAEICSAGLDPRRFLHRLWRMTARPQCAVVEIDDKWAVAAVWGDTAGLLSPEGAMWLFTSPSIERVSLAFYREARREIQDRLREREVLFADVAADYDKAIRFFSMLGFSFDDARPAPRGDALYRRMRVARAA